MSANRLSLVVFMALMAACSQSKKEGGASTASAPSAASSSNASGATTPTLATTTSGTKLSATATTITDQLVNDGYAVSDPALDSEVGELSVDELAGDERLQGEDWEECCDADGNILGSGGFSTPSLPASPATPSAPATPVEEPQGDLIAVDPDEPVPPEGDAGGGYGGGPGGGYGGGPGGGHHGPGHHGGGNHLKISRFLINLQDEQGLPVIGAKMRITREAFEGKKKKKMHKPVDKSQSNELSNIFYVFIAAGDHYTISVDSPNGSAERDIQFDSGKPVIVAFPITVSKMMKKPKVAAPDAMEAYSETILPILIEKECMKCHNPNDLKQEPVFNPKDVDLLFANNAEFLIKILNVSITNEHMAGEKELTDKEVQIFKDFLKRLKDEKPE